MRSLIHRSLAARGVLGAAVGALALALAAGTAGASGSTAATARTITLNDIGHLRETSHRGFNLNYSGQATGTIAGTIYLHLHVTSTNRFSAELSVYPRGSSMTGAASGSYRNNGATASFSGSLSVTRGTGRYSHAHGSGISFSGTIERSNGAVTVRVNGDLSV
jgi:hypothetical protein